jgi:serine protease AprX
MRSWSGRKTRKPAGMMWRRGSTILAVLAIALTPFGGFSSATAQTYDPASDVNSMYNTTSYTGATAWWNAGYTGAGVDIAVIDTGVSPVAGLDTPGKIIYGPDLSLESQAPNLTNLDTNGHGTFMAGLIAGHDSTLTAPYANAPAAAFRGMAPDARIVSLKVGVADGGVDVSQVIAAIDWVVQHAHDPGLNIRVINLSYGTDSTQAYDVDPLAFAIEQAWKAGIFVVAATGNNGYVAHTGSLTNPAFDPKIFAVGASDSMGTTSTADDEVASFSSTGSTSRYVDVVAPGAHVVSLRVPGSYVDQMHGDTGYVTELLFRGSGTSVSAALVSGAAALAIQKYPTITPDYLKNLFLRNTTVLSGFSTQRQGLGEIDLSTMLSAPLLAPSRSWNRISWSSGTGSLELARGTDHISMDGVVLSGEQDIMGSPFDSAAMAKLEAKAKSWSGGDWNGKTWSGASWSGASWSGVSWSGASWSGKSWSSCDFSGASWSGVSWSGASWSGASWSGASADAASSSSSSSGDASSSSEAWGTGSWS